MSGRSSSAPRRPRPEAVFLDANIIRGQLTTNIMLTLAERKVIEPFWSQNVLDEARRNRPENHPARKFDSRLRAMSSFFPDAMVRDFDHLISEMPADPKDKHVLAAAVHAGCDVIVTENDRDFDPPSTGRNPIRVQRMSEFLNRHLEERPAHVISAMRQMVHEHEDEPRSIPALLDVMAEQEALRGFAQKLNAMVPEHERGSHEAPAASQHAAKALDGVAPANQAVSKRPSENDRAHRPDQAQPDRDIER